MQKKLAEIYAESLMRRFPDADTYPYQSWCYAQGFYLWGFIWLYEATGRQDLFDYVRAYGDLHVDEDGNVKGFTGVSLDDIMAGSVLVWLYEQTGEEKYHKAADNIRAAYDDYPRNPDGGFWHGKWRDGEMWVDGLFMSLMFLPKYGKNFGDTDFCWGETVKQLNIVYDRCRKDKTGLLYHAYSANPETPWASRLNGCSPEVWSEGLGWYAMALVESLVILPEDYPGRDTVMAQLKELVRDLLLVQDGGNGLWYQVVDKPGFDGNFHDTSGSAMFLYTLIRARKLGYICGAEVDKAIEKAYRGILTKCLQGMDGEIHVLDACNGLCVQKNYEVYVRYTKTVDAQEAVAAVLWALTAYEFD